MKVYETLLSVLYLQLDGRFACRVAFRELVVGLLSHQLLLQLLGSVLLSGTDLIVSGVSSLLMKQLVSPASASATAPRSDAAAHVHTLPGSSAHKRRTPHGPSSVCANRAKVATSQVGS